MADVLGKPAFAGTPFPTGGVENPQQLTQELGGTGTFNFGGFIRGEDFNPQMDGQTAVKNLDEMRRSDAQAHAALEVVKMPIRTADYEIDPADPDDPVAVQIAEFVRWNLFEGMTTTWDDVVRQALLMLDFGFMIFEKVWTLQEEGDWAGHVVLHKLAPRPPKTVWQWFTDEDGSLLSVKQLTVKAGTYQFLDIPASKLVRFTFQQEGDNYAGISMLRTAYPHWLIKKQLYVIDAIRATRFGVGIPRAKLKDGYKPTEEDRNAISIMLQGLSSHQHAYLIQPPQLDVDILMPQGVQGGAQLLPSINHQNEQITRNILAQFLDMGGKSQGGSRALGASAMDFFLNAIESIADQLCDVLNKQLIKDLVDMNFDVDKYPTLRPVGIAETDVKSLASAAQALAAAGLLTPDKKTENTFRNLMNLPEVPDEESLDGPGATPPPGGAPVPPAGTSSGASGGAAPPGAAPPKPPMAAKPATAQHVPAKPATSQPTAAAPVTTQPTPAASTGQPGPAKTTVTAPTSASPATSQSAPATLTGPQSQEQVEYDDTGDVQRIADAAVVDAKVEGGDPEAEATQHFPVNPHEQSARPELPPGPAQPAATTHDPRQPSEARTGAYQTLPATTTWATAQPAVSAVRDPAPANSTVSDTIPATARMDRNYNANTAPPPPVMPISPQPVATARSSTSAPSGDADGEGHSWSEVALASRRRPKGPRWTLEDGLTSLWRPPTEFETKVLDLRETPRRLDTERAALLNTLRGVREEQILRIASAVAHADDPAAIKAPLVGKLASDIQKAMRQVFTYGANKVKDELAKQKRGLHFADAWEGMAADDVARALAAPKSEAEAVPMLVASANLSAQSTSDRLLSTARGEALRLQRAGWDANEIEDALKIHLGEMSDADISRVASQEVNEAFSLGRVATVAEFKGQIEKAIYSAILDNNVCDVCEELDGQEFALDSDEYEENMPPNANCHGGDACRCTYLYVLSDSGGGMREVAFDDEWDESKHPRDGHGRFGAGVATVPNVHDAFSQLEQEQKQDIDREAAKQLSGPATFYHGTTDEAWADIQKEGLIPHKGAGGDAWAAAHGIGPLVYDVGDRHASIYMSKDKEESTKFAVLATQQSGGDPLLLRVKIPKDQVAKLHRDEQDYKAVRFEGKIPPAWISLVRGKLPDVSESIDAMGRGARIRSGQLQSVLAAARARDKELGLADGDVVVYAVLMCGDQKSFGDDFDENKHPRGHGGKFVSGVATPEELPPSGRRAGFIAPDGKDHVARATGGLGNFGEDHTDIARRLLNNPDAGVREALNKGYVRYWVKNGEIDMNFKAGLKTASDNALQLIHDNYTHGDRIYLDIEGADPLGHFFDNVREANQAIRQAATYKQKHSDVILASDRAWALALDDWDESKHPRDKGGRFGQGEGGGKKDAYVRPVPIKVHTLEEAVSHILAGDVVELSSVHEVGTVMERLAAIAQEAKSLGKDAPKYDMCQVSVPGTNLFCGSQVTTKEFPHGIPRIAMPQLGGTPVPGSEADKLPRTKWNPNEVDAGKQFANYLREKGISASDIMVPAASLKASQSELNGPKVAAMMVDTKFDVTKNPLFISRDGYVIDGHHRWAAAVGRDAASGQFGHLRMRAIRVDAPVTEVLKLANAWSKSFGIKQAAAH